MMQDTEFQELIWQKGRELFRTMPWRGDTRPYYVLVSELMLQQTQVERVVSKFQEFIAEFPDEAALARASLGDVLRRWQGLGYNRRAKYLHEAARQIVGRGAFPDRLAELVALPGVGKNTAGAILAYSFNQPSLFIETNIRTVYIHHFFDDEQLVDDKQILERLQATLDHEHPREFYWALMDYGSWLKRNGAGRLAQSKHYKKQTPLEGSVRQVRGQIITMLTEGDVRRADIEARFSGDPRLATALNGLVTDGLVVARGEWIHLTK